MYNFIEYIDVNKVKESSIEDLLKIFVSNLIELYDIPDDKIIGVKIGLPKTENDKSVFVFEFTFRPSLFDYYTICFNNKLEIINEKLYKKYIPNRADVLMELHKLVLEMLNELGKNNNININEIEYKQIYKKHGVNFNYIYCRPCHLDNMSKIINNIKLFINITKDFDKYKVLDLED